MKFPSSTKIGIRGQDKKKNKFSIVTFSRKVFVVVQGSVNILLSCRYKSNFPVDTKVSIKISSAYAELVQLLYKPDDVKINNNRC